MRRHAARLASGETGLLVVILAAALGVRLLGVGRGLPYIHEWDEPSVLSYVVRMLQRGDFNPGEYIYPGVYYYLLLPVVYAHYLYLHAHGVLGSLWDIQLSQPQEPYWYMDPPSFYVWGRALTSLIGTATVAAIYQIGRRAYGSAVGLLAAAFLAVAPGAVYFSDTVRVDVPMAFVVILAILAGIGIIRRGRLRDYLLAGVLGGLAISTKTTAFMIVPALLIAHVMNPHRTRLVDLRVSAMGLCVLAGAIAGTPYVFIVPHAVFAGARGLAAQWGGIPRFVWMRRSLPEYLTYLVRPNQAGDWTLVPHAGFGLPAVFALLGIAAGFRSNRPLHTYLLSFPVLYFLFMSGQQLFPVRTMMAVVPFVALFAAVGCVAAWEWLQRRMPPTVRPPWRRGLAGVAVAILLAAPARETAGLARTLRQQPDTRVAAVEWLLQHAAPGARVAFENDLRWHTPDLYHLPFALRFPPRDAARGWYVEQHVDFAVVGTGSPLRTLPAVAAFPRPGYLGPEAKYPVIDPVLYIVRPSLPDVSAAVPLRLTAGNIEHEPVVTTASGASFETVHLPDQRFTPGFYALLIAGEWPVPGVRADRLTATVLVDRRTVGTVTLDGTQPLRFTTPAFRIDRTQTFPVRVDLAYRIRRRRPDPMGALYPPANGCAIAADAPNLDVQQLTLEAWVYLEDLGETGRGTRAGESEAPILTKGNHEGYYLRLVRGGAHDRVFTELSVAGKFAVGRAPFVPFKRWTHIAATYDGHEARLYLNGRPAPLSRDPHHEGIVRAAGAPLVIGCRDPGTPSPAIFRGLITGVRIWNRVLPLDTIRQDAGLLPGPDTREGLVGSWSFLSAVQGKVSDSSGTGNDLTVKSVRRIPAGSDPAAYHPEWALGRLLRSIAIRRVTFPVTVDAGEMTVWPSVSNAVASSRTEYLPDQPFTPGSYVLTVDGEWPRPGASPNDRLIADVVVGHRTVGTATLSGAEPLHFTTAPFQVDRVQTLPVRVELTPKIQQRALDPRITGCAVAPDAAHLDPQQLTVEAWVYLEHMNRPRDMQARGLESEAPILTKAGHQGYYLRLVGDANDKIYADLSVAGKFSVGRAGFVPLRRWTHIAATYDGRAAQIYLNGVAAPPNRDPRHVGEVHAEKAPLVIGCRDPGTPGQVMFEGLITGVRIWNRVLPADAIRDEAGRHPFPDKSDGLVGSWLFQSAVRGVVPDLSDGGSGLGVDSLRLVPNDVGPPVRPEWMAGGHLLSTATIGRLTFPVTVNVRDTRPRPVISTAAGASTETVRLDQPFSPGSYAIFITAAWPPPAASASDRLTARVMVGGRMAGAITVTGAQPLRFRTPPFQIERLETLPVQVEFTSWAERRALHPPDDGCATAPDAANLNPQELTVEAWVYPEGMNEPLDMRARGLESENPILNKGNHHGYFLRLVGDTSNRIFADLSVAGKFSVGRGGFVPLRQWTHIAATYDGREARIYLNGAPVPPERNPLYEGTVQAQGAPLVIGCRDPGTPDQLVFIGFIDRARVWNTVLSPEAIRREAGADRPSAAAGLVGSWAFQSLVRGTVPDQSGASSGLAVESLQVVPKEIGAPVRPTRTAGQTTSESNLLRTITIERLSP